MADSADTFSDVILLKNCCNVRMSDFLSKHEIRKIDDQIKAEAVVDDLNRCHLPGVGGYYWSGCEDARAQAAWAGRGAAGR